MNITNQPVIIAEKLTRIYSMGAAELIALNQMSLKVISGELVVIKGDSGSGKSTLLSLLAGLDTPTQGRLTVAGRDLNTATEAELTRYRREAVGMVFQSFNLLPTLNILENVCLPALLAGRPHAPVQSKAVELLEWLHLKDRFQHLPDQLSGGEMQRTAIARALINDPEIVLADEPTGNLDSRNGEAVMELLADLNREQGRTIIIATHSDFADAFASKQIRLRDGVCEESR